MSFAPRIVNRTKIIATIGPASASPEMLKRLIECGVDIFRLNFSHGTLEGHATVLGYIRTLAAELDAPVAVLGDLSGPKIRLNPLADPQGFAVATGDQLMFQRAATAGSPGRVSCNYAPMVDEVSVGDRVLVDDGQVRFIVVDKTDDELVCQCTTGGRLLSRKGVNLPDTPLSIEAITQADRACVEWAASQALDYLALSFVRRPGDVDELRALTGRSGVEIPIIAKIERPEAIDSIDAIIDRADAVMVARGDLGVELDMAQVPLIQKDVIRRCNLANKPVIVATQMLQSMVEALNPTRAEVSDVANAIFDDADAVMLSGETAVGRHPAVAVAAMAHIARVAESAMLAEAPRVERWLPGASGRSQKTALAQGACMMAHRVQARAMAVWCRTGELARMLSRLRPVAPIIAVTSDPVLRRRMNLLHGVMPRLMQVPNSLHELAPAIDAIARRENLAEPGQNVVIIAGTDPRRPGESDAIVIRRVGAS
jgi:pyruvate kinase